MATSGSIDTSSNAFWATDGSRYFVLSWSATQYGYSADHPHGYSAISWSLKGGGTSSQGIKCKNWQCQVGPQWKGDLSGTKTSLKNGTVLTSGSFNIDHDANGNASFYLGISGYIYYYGSNYERKASGTAYLNQLTTYWDINVYDPDNKQGISYGYTVGTFDEYISNSKKNSSPIDNEMSEHIYQPYGTWVSIDNFSFSGPYQFRDVYNGSNGTKSRKIERYQDPYGSNRYGHYITGYNDDLYIYTDWKQTTITFDLNNGSWKPNSGITSNKRDMTYNSTTSNAPIPIRTGYKFLGWYTTKDSGTTQVFKADGTYNSNATSYWNSSGGYKGTNDLTLYANWKIQNVAYVKTENGWKLATVYVKTEKGWEPAILYVKTSDGWKQSVV